MAERVKILLVDDQPAKLLSYETMLEELGEDLIQANSGKEALEQLLKYDVAVILIDVMMPDLDGFQLAELIREHPRFRKTGIIFVSAFLMTDADRLRGYDLGAVDFVSVPVIPELLRAKVRVFVELFRKTQQLESMNTELERRVAERTAEIEETLARLSMAVEVAQLGTWDLNIRDSTAVWSDEFLRLSGRKACEIQPTLDGLAALVHPDDRSLDTTELQRAREGKSYHHVFRCVRPDGGIVWCDARARYEFDANGKLARMLGVIRDITEQKQAAEQQVMMMQELHHRVKNSLTTVQAIANLSRRTATDIESFSEAFNSRIVSLSKTHTLLVDNKWNRIHLSDILTNELSAFEGISKERFEFSGVPIDLPTQLAVSLGMAFHELTTNAVKYGALSVPAGRLKVSWSLDEPARKNDCQNLVLQWREYGGPLVTPPTHKGFGMNLFSGLFNEHNGSRVDLLFEPAGLNFQLAMPWTEH